MPAERYFIDADSFKAGQEIILQDEEQRHLIRVMRTDIGEAIELVNGRHQLAQAVLIGFDKNSARLKVGNVETKDSPPRKILAQAIPKINRLETIIEKGTELNVTEFWLFPGHLSEKEALSPTQEKRLQQIAISALKQCGRLDLPQIIVKPHFEKWPSLKIPCYFGDTRKDAPVWEQRESERLFFIGPEKGFSTAEERFLENLARGVKLHDNILRVDTAAIIASYL